MEGDGADVERGIGVMLRTQWGCPAGGCKPVRDLPDTVALPLARTARHVARVAALFEPPTTCPFACLESADPFTLRVMRAVSRAGDRLRIPVDRSLPGGMTAADDAAIDAWMCATGAAASADEDDRKKADAKPA